jgi:pyruvate dehydrogenase E2 component (dihydrolipoamide acetyltransferase)/2-oxoisovalerate dehydrogenase E2 component (dihydrolipoyl transacylase)
MNASILTVTLPDIGEGVVEGEVIAWLKKVGDSVAQDEPVVVVMTDKATVELPAPRPGKLAKFYHQVGEIALRDKPLYDIELSTKVIHSPPQEKVQAAPAVRKMAMDLGIDISQMTGSGKEGRVTKEDLKPHTSRPLHESHTAISRFQGDTETPLVGIQHLMAEKMAESKHMIPHFSYFEQADLTRLIQTKDKIAPQATSENINLTFMPFFIRALSLTLLQFPIMNSSLDAEKSLIVYHKPQNIGIAMSTPHGLIVPVLKNVQDLKLPEIIRAFDALKKRAFTNQLHPSDMKEGTITITNFGTFEGHSIAATPIINYPEVAIVGFAKVMKQPKVINSEIAIRDLTTICLSFDHRVIDGSLAAQIASNMSTLLENPGKLI